MFQDKTLTCRDCGTAFVFTTGEQEFYQSRGLMNEPGRCPDCRRARKNRSASGGYDSGTYTSGGYSTGGGDYERQPRQMYSATCAGCGGEALLPFEPRTEKPVYCSDCFRVQRDAGSGYRSSRY
ncbi:MAG TPA: zinc-ribbon domain containing protein [Dehalococcoidia bacterium]|nr:zinc-ribbon domain containing protein [Dehalococcoidia bacterium]